MKPEYEAYAAARDAVVQVQRQLTDAEQALRDAEAPIHDLVQAAWDRNQAVVQRACEDVDAALRDQSTVETQCALLARGRDAKRPRLNESEQAAVEEAKDRTSAARAAHKEAIDTFKAGVTAEQLEELG